MVLTIVTALLFIAVLVAAAVADARSGAESARFSAVKRVLCQRSVCDIQPRVAE